jgi:hypothetical protein
MRVHGLGEWQCRIHIRRMTVEERVNPLIEEAVGLPNDRKAILAVSCFTTNLGNPDDSSDDAVYDSI